MEDSYPLDIEGVVIKGNNRTSLSYFSSHLDQVLVPNSRSQSYPSSISSQTPQLTYGNAHSYLINVVRELDSTGSIYCPY